MENKGRLVYAPTILSSMAAICKAFGVGKERVKEWQKAGAPIVVDGDGEKRRYSAEVMRLQMWRESTQPRFEDESQAG